MASTISRDIHTGMSCLLVETVVHGYHVYKVLWEPRVGETFIALREINSKYRPNCEVFGIPLPELETIYPICAKGCRKIRDAEFFRRYTIFQSNCAEGLHFSAFHWIM